MTVEREQGPQQPLEAQSVQATVKRVLRQIVELLRLASTPIRKLPWWADVLSVVAFGLFLYQVGASLVPEVQPDPMISSSSYDLPITVKNPGAFLFIKDAEFFCDMTQQDFSVPEQLKNASPFNYYRLRGLVEWKIQQPPLNIAPGVTTSFPCSIAARSKLNMDGVSLTLKQIHLSIRTRYTINLRLFQWHRESKSQTFTWGQVSGGWQWLPGETPNSVASN